MTGDEAAPRPAPETIVSGGAAYSVRPLCSEDEGRLREFFQSHSRETVQSRYGYMISTMTRERARSLVNVDQVRDVALGVFEGADRTRCSMPSGATIRRRIPEGRKSPSWCASRNAARAWQPPCCFAWPQPPGCGDSAGSTRSF